MFDRAPRVSLMVLGVVAFLGGDAAFACRSGIHPRPVATMEQALKPRPGEISFVGKIVEDRGWGEITVEVVKRFQGDVGQAEVVLLPCNANWGKAGDVIPIIGVRSGREIEGFGGVFFDSGGQRHDRQARQ